MIVGIGFFGIAIHVGADAEAQIGIFVNHLPVGRVVIDVAGDEFFILERFLD